MAYLLRTPTGLNSAVSLSSSINLFSNVGDYLEIRCSIRNTNGQSIVGINNSFDDFIQMQTSRIRMRMAPANLDFSTNYTMPSPDAEFILRFERVSSSQIQGFLDGESIGVVTSTDSLNFNQLLRSQNDSVGRFEGDVYYIKGSFNGGVSDTFNYNKQTLNGSNDTTFPDTVGGNDGTLVNFQTDNSQWVFFDDGGGAVDPEPELHAFSGNATVNALSFAQISKTAQHNGLALVNVSTSGQSAKSVTLSSDSLVTALASASSSKVFNTSGAASIKAQSVSLFEKLNTFSGNATVNATSQSSASKRVAFDGRATVSITASASIIDGNFEIHSFSGGALITASASGQTVKVGLVSGNANVTTSTSAQASKTAQLSGNATVATSTQSLFSKIAGISGNALTRVTTLTSAFKRVTLSGASRVFATAYGTFFNTESNVETYELTVQGRVKAPIVVQGTIKSLTIQGRVK